MTKIGFKKSSFIEIVIFCSAVLHHASSSSSSSSSSSPTEWNLAKVRLNDSSTIRALDSFIERLMDCRKIPGLVLAVVGADEDVLRREYGYANVEESVPMTDHTRLCIASCTKAFSSVLLGKVLNNTRYSWNTPVSEILPNRCQFPEEYRTELVTILDVLSHRTGVDRAYDPLWYSGIFDRTELFNRIRFTSSENKFRSTAIYNNIVYSLVGDVTEAIARQEGGGGGGGGSSHVTWEELMKTRILRPLKMYNTSFYHMREEPQNFATSYGFVAGQAVPLEENLDFFRGVGLISSSVSLCTTSSDISLWMKCLLSGMLRDECKVVAKEVIDSTMKEQVLAGEMYHSYIMRPRTSASLIIDAYGMGWFTGYYRERRIVMHYGSLPGTYTMLMLVPDLELGIFLSHNGAIQFDPYTLNSMIIAYLIDLALDVSPWIQNEDDACNFSMPLLSRPTPFTPPFIPLPHPAFSYVGRYRHRLFGEVSVRFQDNGLHLLYGTIDSELLPWNQWDGNDFKATPTLSSWEQIIGYFFVSFSQLKTFDHRRIFCHVTVPFIGDDSHFVRIGKECGSNDAEDQTSRGLTSSANSYDCKRINLISWAFALSIIQWRL